MTDELRHDSSVQETPLAHSRRQPPRAQRWQCVERAALGRQHPSGPTQEAVIGRTQPCILITSSPEGPEPESEPQEEMTASSDHHLLPVNVRAHPTQSKLSETKNWDTTQKFRAEIHTVDVETSPWAPCGQWCTEQMTELRKVKRSTKSTAGQSCVNPTWMLPELWGLSELQVPVWNVGQGTLM